MPTKDEQEQRIEDEFARNFAALERLEADPIANAEKIAELNAHGERLINEMMRLFPEEFVQHPDGKWKLRENLTAEDLKDLQ
jgi:hypothetical protein